MVTLVSNLGEMAEVAKKELLQLVPKLTELQLLEVTNGLGLKLSKSKKDRKVALHNLLVRHITSEDVEDSDDEGLALFNQLLTQVKELIEEDEEEMEDKAAKANLERELENALKGLKSTVNEFGYDAGGPARKDGTDLKDSFPQDVKPQNSLQSSKSPLDGQTQGSSGNQITTQFHKINLREFKISNGTVGGEGSLDYSDLISQMKEGIEIGYGEKEVMAGVVRASKPGSELRKYLVRHPNMTYSDFKDTLREFYNVRESQNIKDEMKEMVQGPPQPLLKY